MRLGCAVRCRLVVSLTAPDTHPQAPPKPAPSSSEESSEDEDSIEEDVPMKVRRLGREARCDHPVRCTSPPFPASPRQQRRSRRVWCHFSGLLAVSVRAAVTNRRIAMRPSQAARGAPSQPPRPLVPVYAPLFRPQTGSLDNFPTTAGTGGRRQRQRQRGRQRGALRPRQLALAAHVQRGLILQRAV